MKVDETEIVKLKPGQNAKVTVDAVEKVTYEGRVTEIGNTAIRQGDVNVFNVKVLLVHPDENLRPGMTAKARIEVDKRSNVLRIPVQAVTARERKKLDEEKSKAGLAKGGAKASGTGAQGDSTGGSSASSRRHEPAVAGGGGPDKVSLSQDATASAKGDKSDKGDNC